jgi:hypothetical protein
MIEWFDDLTLGMHFKSGEVSVSRQWFSNFLLKAFVSRVNRLMLIRMVRFCPSANKVLIEAVSGSP